MSEDLCSCRRYYPARTGGGAARMDSGPGVVNMARCMRWEQIGKIANAWLPKPRILHPWPNQRLAVKHPRWNPGARIVPVGICAGVSSNGYPYRDTLTLALNRLWRSRLERK
jgi:hypothetical protein